MLSKRSTPRTFSDPPARRLRSILAGAASLSVRTGEHRADLVARHTVGEDGRLRIDLPMDSRLSAEVLRRREAVAVIDITDLAPTPVRDRVRARAVLSGWLSPAWPPPVGTDLTVLLDLASAELHTAEHVTTVDPDDLATAEPDPLAEMEAELLCHLDTHHPRTVRRLCHLLDPRHLDGARRVVPVRLDRHGLVLRCEHPERYLDVRLGFDPVLRHVGELGAHVDALLHRADGCHRP